MKRLILVLLLCVSGLIGQESKPDSSVTTSTVFSIVRVIPLDEFRLIQLWKEYCASVKPDTLFDSYTIRLVPDSMYTEMAPVVIKNTSFEGFMEWLENKKDGDK